MDLTLLGLQLPIALILSIFFLHAECGIGLGPFDFLLGNGEDLDKVIAIAFRPDDGIKLREKFERKHGVRGERLIARLGEGYDVEDEPGNLQLVVDPPKIKKIKKVKSKVARIDFESDEDSSEDTSKDVADEQRA